LLIHNCDILLDYNLFKILDGVFVTQKGRAVARTTAESDGCRGWGYARSKSKGNSHLYYL